MAVEPPWKESATVGGLLPHPKGVRNGRSMLQTHQPEDISCVFRKRDGFSPTQLHSSLYLYVPLASHREMAEGSFKLTEMLF